LSNQFPNKNLENFTVSPEKLKERHSFFDMIEIKTEAINFLTLKIHRMKKLLIVCLSLVMTSGVLFSVSSCGPSHKTPSENPGMQSDSTRMQNNSTDTSSSMSTDTSHRQPGR